MLAFLLLQKVTLFLRRAQVYLTLVQLLLSQSDIQSEFSLCRD